jgi:hypothetical protein
MGLFRRSASSDSSSSKPNATDDQLRQIGSLVNQGRLDEAKKISDSTRDPKMTALAAFRYIDLEGE